MRGASQVKPGNDKWGGYAAAPKREKPRPGVAGAFRWACEGPRASAPARARREILLGGRAEVARQAGRGRPELLHAAQRMVGGVEPFRRELDVVELQGVLVEQCRPAAEHLDPLARGADVEGTAVVRRALLDEISEIGRASGRYSECRAG